MFFFSVTEVTTGGGKTLTVWLKFVRTVTQYLSFRFPSLILDCSRAYYPFNSHLWGCKL